MDRNLVMAIVASVTTAGSTAGVAITALVISNKPIDRVEASLDQLSGKTEAKFDRLDAKFDRLQSKMDTKFEEVQTTLNLINGNLHEIDKRLGIVEDWIFNCGVSGD